MQDFVHLHVHTQYSILDGQASISRLVDKAIADVETGRCGDIPDTIKIHSTIYKYPHDFGGYVKQQYLPTVCKNDIYYEPSNNGREKNMVRKKFDSRVKK